MYKIDPKLSARVFMLLKSFIDSKYRVSGHVLTGPILDSVVDSFSNGSDLSSDNPTTGARISCSLLCSYLFLSSVSRVSVSKNKVCMNVTGDCIIQYLASRGVKFYFTQAMGDGMNPDFEPYYTLFFSPAAFVDMIFKLFDLDSTRYVKYLSTQV